jgi:hypothetical protein
LGINQFNTNTHAQSGVVLGYEEQAFVVIAGYDTTDLAKAIRTATTTTTTKKYKR